MQKLGFGMMRLPTVDPKATEQIDLPQVCGMVDTFLARGYTYFDTAYFYHGGKSEYAARDALVKRHSRESFLLADKLPLMHLKDADSGEAQSRIFYEQLDKCGVDYFDYYLLHCITRESYEVAQRLDTFTFLQQMQAEGKLRHLGFSFHDKADVLEQVLSEHPEVEFVQLQLNYLDWEDERVQSQKCYETVLRHGKQVIVMEPVKGGKLAALPEEAAALLRAAHPDWSPAQWALRFAAGLDQVMMVLSGMSTLGQVEENTLSMAAPEPLCGEDRALLERTAEILSAIPAIACTACRYCVDGCPREIPIPDYFALYNSDQAALRQGREPDRARYRSLSEGAGTASSCVSCRQCEQQCPQHLEITTWLERVKKMYEG